MMAFPKDEIRPDITQDNWLEWKTEVRKSDVLALVYDCDVLHIDFEKQKERLFVSQPDQIQLETWLSDAESVLKIGKVTSDSELAQFLQVRCSWKFSKLVTRTTI